MVLDAASRVTKAVELSMALFGAKAAALSQLASIASECSEPGWDGYSADAISRGTIILASTFVRALPDDAMTFELAPEPDGSISIDWTQSRNRVLSLSIGRNHRLAYAWLDGSEKGHAVANFDGKTVPPRVLEAIRSIVGKSNVGLWAA